MTFCFGKFIFGFQTAQKEAVLFFKMTEKEYVAIPDEEIKKTVETVGKLVAIVAPLVEKVADSKIMEETGWGASLRKPATASNWEWTRLYAGFLAVGQERALRGANDETLDLQIRYKPEDLNERPDDFSIFGGGERKIFRFKYDRQYQSIEARFTDKDTVYFVYISKSRGVSVTIAPASMAQVAVFYKDVEVEPGGWILFGKRPMEVAESPAQYHKTPVGDTNQIYSWYLRQGFIHEDKESVEEWLAQIPQEINWREILTGIEGEVQRTVDTLLAIADNSSLGSVFTQEELDKKFKESFERVKKREGMVGEKSRE